MDSWRDVALSEVASEVTVGFVGKMADQYVDDGIPFLRSQNVRAHRIDLADIKFVDKDFHARLKKSALRPGDVVTVRTGAPGTTAVIPESLTVANCSDLVITRPGAELNSRWLSYYLNFVIDSHINGHLVGAVQQHFNVQSAKGLRLRLPEIGEQEAIAEVLGALDDKIAANDRVLAAAEALMQAIVEAVGPSVPLSAIARQSTASRKPADFESTVAHFSLPAFDQAAIPEVVGGSTIMSNKFALSEPCVLFSKLNPRIPRIWNVVDVPSLMALASTEFVVLIPNGVGSSALWSALRQPDVSESMRQKVSGTSGSHQRIKPAELMDVSVRDVRTLSALRTAAITSLGKHCQERRHETLKLTTARDDLLPLLMSGKVRVKDAEAVVSDVV